MKIEYKDKLKLGKKIKKYRLALGKSLRGFAADCEMNYATLNDIENGNGFPTEEVFFRLVEKLELNAAEQQKMYNLYAQIKGTAPPDIIDFFKSIANAELFRKVINANTNDIDTLKLINELRREQNG